MAVPPLTRRSVLRGVGLTVVGAVAGFLVARSSDADEPAGQTAAANGYGPPEKAGRQVLARVSDIPAGGGIVAGGLVLSRTGGDVQAFSATCTHQGCTLSEVVRGVAVCPCHGSEFDARTGAVVTGPATRPLPAVPVDVVRDEVVRA